MNRRAVGDNEIGQWLFQAFTSHNCGGAKRFVGWRDWTINGNEIDSGTGLRIVARDGVVYYRWENQAPEPMTPFTLE